MDQFTLMDQWQREGIDFLFMVDFEGKQPYLFPLKELDEHEEIWVQFPSYSNHSICTAANAPSLQAQMKPFEEYQQQFDKVLEEIHLGNTYLLNLCVRTPLIGEYNLETIFEVAQAPFKLKFKNEFCCFSPEKFISIDAHTIRTFPMKGTIDATLENAAQLLLENKKESAEHATVVDLLRNDISQVATDVQVEKYRYLERIPSNQNELWQASSEISGTLLPAFQNSIGSILRKMLPAGSISGAPKEKTVEIIHEVESEKRGFYTGVMGICKKNKVESAVMIRYLENENNRYFYRSGGGITYMSNAQEEYEEIEKKIYVPIF